ncbi:methylthioribulose 1-phosphate dehydratase [Paenibacillus macerans]|uniref:methylthioribulose 1-phosphate dehydratase n=1 Tax=Paenibacillus macerans TaxID=44252 RepID=UPI003D30F6F3
MTFSAIPWEEKQAALGELRGFHEQFAERSRFPDIGGSLSVRVGDFAPSDFYFAVASGGKNISAPAPEGFLFVDAAGEPCEATRLEPVADTPIHAKIYRMTGSGAIIHAHTVMNNVLSEYYGDEGYVPAQGIESIKELGIGEENAAIRVPILPNHAEISAIAKRIPRALDTRIPGILLRGHGIYAWGQNANEARCRLEAFEFIFEVLHRSIQLPPKR